MSRFPRVLGAVQVAALLLLGTACGSPAPPATAAPLSCPTPANAPLALAVGARANVPAPNLPQSVSDLMDNVAMAHQALTVIRLDGSPAVVFGDPPPSVLGNPVADQQAVKNYLNSAANAYTTMIRAKVPQADVLDALSLAARATGRSGTIVLIDSGLQTTAPLDFATDGLLIATPEDVVKFLQNQPNGSDLPDLTGRTVLLIGFGNTAPPQPELATNLRNRVTAIWSAIAKASGACVSVLDQATTAQSAVDSPAVDVVPIPTPTHMQSCGQIQLGENDDISFLPDTATFRDPVGARQTVAQLANLLRGNTSERAQLTGTTADQGDMAGQVALSRQRADTVKSVLVSLGVTADRITTTGVGSNWPGHVPDLGPGGVLLPGPAAANRKVVVQLTCASNN
jgi:outer membrane protein OmpA-like peptidoglycan-associated protein